MATFEVIDVAGNKISEISEVDTLIKKINNFPKEMNMPDYLIRKRLESLKRAGKIRDFKQIGNIKKLPGNVCINGVIQ